MTAETAKAVVIGGGVVGCAVLHELAMRGIDAILVESEPDICEGASKANSAIIHTGFDATAGTIEARLLRRSAERWPDVLDDLGVPSLTCGALMLARDSDETARLPAIAAAAAGHGVEAEIVDQAWLRREAAYVAAGAMAALHVAGEAIVDPFWLTRAYAESAIALGARLWTRASVTRLAVTEDHVDIELADGRAIRAGQAFDCAGIRADDVARLAGDMSFTLTPRKGQFLVSERIDGVDRIVLPIPGPLGKGMLVTPIVFGGVLLGPTAEDGDDKADRSTTDAGRRRILESCRGLVPAVADMEPIRSFAGVRAVSSTGDYIIRPSTAGDRLTIVAGIRSTGISASPAIAEVAVDLAVEARGWKHRPAARTTVSSGPELASNAGPVVCVCRSVGAAEVTAALAGRMALRTTDALKRRSGVGFGDCQGNRCLAVAIERVAEAAGLEPIGVEKHLDGSWLIAAAGEPVPADGARNDPAGNGAAAAIRDGLPGGRAGPPDVVVIGGGLAGIGAATTLADAGFQVTVVDRGRQPGGMLAAIGRALWTADERAALETVGELVERGAIEWVAAATVVGLGVSPTGWLVDVVTDDGTEALEATSVLLATGGYLTPREHRSIDGPRPSGVMTADFVTDALDRGWRPGRRVIVAGRGRIARGTAERLSRAGVDILDPGRSSDAPADSEEESPIDEVRGERRLNGVRIDGRWIEADGLVLADALRPASFLLRGLGIGDDRPGVPISADDSGALPIANLWAAGTCVDPRVDHDRSLAAGIAVGHTIVTAGLRSHGTAASTRR